MRCLFDDIGLVTAGLHSHLGRIASIEHDSHEGGGSTATEDEELTDDEKAQREADEGNDDLDGDEDGGRRRPGRDAAAYRELQSDRDKLKHDLDAQRREAQELKDRLATLERGAQTRDTVNQETNSRLERARKRAEEVMSEIEKLPADDPQRGRKIYETLFAKVLEDQEATAKDVSQRTSRDIYRTEQTLEDQRARAKQETLDALENAGLEPEDFDLVEALAIQKASRDPDWFKQVKPEDQIQTLVNIVKDRFVKTKRNSQEFKDEKKDHRRPMAGVIGEGSRNTRRSMRDQDDDDRQEGPGSILADLARNKAAKRRDTNIMLRQVDPR